MANEQENTTIPIIDLAPEALDKAPQHAYKAFKNFGFAYIKNHEIPETFIDQAFEWAAKFFALPQDTKKKCLHPPNGWYHRGYSGLGVEKVSQMIFDLESIAKERKVPDCKESFELGSQENHRLSNIWPPEDALPGFRDFFTRFYDTCYTVELKLLRIIAASIGLEESYFLQFHSPKANQLRLLHYPPIEEALLREGKAERVGAHTDFGTITMLFQDRVGGLEVEDMDQPGRFIPVPYIPGTIVVNIGDLLMRWTNDELRSTMHRVRTATCDKAQESGPGRMTDRRYAMPYFICPDGDQAIECVPGCYGPDRPKKYEKFICGEYMDMRLDAIYS